MKKFIVLILVISVLCLCGCQKNNAEISNNSSEMEHIDNLNNSIQDVTNSSDSNSSTNVTSDSNVSENNTPSNETDKPVRPEKVTNIYKFNVKIGNNEHIKKTFYDLKNGNTLQYCLFLPDDYSPEKKYPVILFLHGAGEIGNDNSKHLGNIKNMFAKNPDYISQSILICPQTPEWWRLDRDTYGDRKGTLSSAMNLLFEIQNQYSCDKNRIYVTGLSMGGYATWEVLQNYGEVFAAGVPVCGFGNEAFASAFVDIPIRIYHGTADPTVSFSSSQSMYDAIVAAGGKNIELFPLEGVGHDAWHTAYADSSMFAWLFAQDKSKEPPKIIEVPSAFRVVDTNGNTIITDDDVKEVNYSIIGAQKTSDVDIELLLLDEGREKLEKAYIKSDGAEFTVYYRLQKIYSFTATKPPIDNTFLISGVFKIDNYLAYYNLLNDACFENK